MRELYGHFRRFPYVRELKCWVSLSCREPELPCGGANIISAYN